MKGCKVVVIGLRGFPNIQGGIESHCEHLYPYVAREGYEVLALSRRPYSPEERVYSHVKVKPIWSPTKPGLETTIHTFLSVIYALRTRPDIVHFHAIGPSFFAPLVRLFGVKVVCTQHGFDYEREKWGPLASFLLRCGERMAGKYANGFIAVSKLAAERLEKEYGRPVYAISNGAVVQQYTPETGVLERFGLINQPYFLSVSRVVEEKRQLDIVAAYLKLPNPTYKLVIVGGDGGDGAYYKKLRKQVQDNPNIVVTGTQTGPQLATLFAHGSAFVHASSLEGNPIVMLEAMSYGLPIIASDIAPNLELGLEPGEHFELGNTSELAEKMQQFMFKPSTKQQSKIERIRNEFSWKVKARQTTLVYRDVMEQYGAGAKGAGSNCKCE